MKKLLLPLILLSTFLFSACSNQQLHQMFQSNQKSQCDTGPVSEHDDCIKRNSETYEEYSRKREELIQNS